MIELSIPQTGEETRNSKDLVFSILSRRQPLTAIEIANRVRKHYNVGLTYQAIKKAIDSLREKGVLVRQGKRYRISREWLMNLKNTAERLIAATAQGERPVKHAISKGDYASYTLTSLLELDNFWDDILTQLANKLKPEEPRVFFSLSTYGWWLLINLGKETQLFEHLSKRGLACHVLFLGDYPLNRWANNIYRDEFGKFLISPESSRDDSTSLNVIGDMVIQVAYPKQIREKLRRFYAKYETVQEMSMREITELANQECEIQFNIFRNPEIARSITEKYLKLFK